MLLTMIFNTLNAPNILARKIFRDFSPFVPIRSMKLKEQYLLFFTPIMLTICHIQQNLTSSAILLRRSANKAIDNHHGSYFGPSILPFAPDNREKKIVFSFGPTVSLPFRHDFFHFVRNQLAKTSITRRIEK